MNALNYRPWPIRPLAGAVLVTTTLLLPTPDGPAGAQGRNKPPCRLARRA